MLKRSNFIFLRIIAIDVGLTLMALGLAKSLREIIPLGINLNDPLQFTPWLFLIVPIIWVLVFITLKVYSPARSLRYTTDLPAVWAAIIGASLIFAGVAYLLFRELSRFLFFYFFILDIVFLSVWRLVLARFPSLVQGLYGVARRRVLIVGAGSLGQAFAQAITKHPATYLTLVGFVDDDNPKVRPQNCEGYPVLGGLSDVPRLIHDHQLQEIVFALPPTKQPALRQLVMALQVAPVNLRLIPDVFDLVFLRASVEEYEGIPLVGLSEPAIAGLDRLIKRLFDLTFSLLLLVIFAPVMIIVALLIKLDSPGPVFFRQRRVGEDGHLFWMVKFRTMVDGAEQEETQLLRETADNRPLFIKTRQDPRITRLGRVLRRTSLDELPQLFNVLKGEMSLVGPRPELPWLVERYEPWQRKRFAVPQGITGWWQVNGRMERGESYERVEDDLFYIRNYSLWLDLRILWKTILAVIYGEGAY